MKICRRVVRETRNGFAEVKEEMEKGFGEMQKCLADVRDEVHLQWDDFKSPLFLQATIC